MRRFGAFFLALIAVIPLLFICAADNRVDALGEVSGVDEPKDDTRRALSLDMYFDI